MFGIIIVTNLEWGIILDSLGRKDRKKEKKQSIFTAETFGVVTILFATLCLVCLITRDKLFSVIGLAINSFLFGMFGYFSYFYFVLAILFGIKLLVGKKSIFSFKTKLYMIITFASVVLLVHIATMNGSGATSYGEYLSISYSRGNGGVSESSGGGLVAGLLGYVFAFLLTNVGCYVLFGALIAFGAYMLIKRFAFINSADERGAKEKFRSSYKGSENEGLDIPKNIEGVQDYPVDIENKYQNNMQKLFVNNPGDFAFKTRKEVKNQQQSEGIKIDFSSGIGQAVYNSQAPVYKDEAYRQKLDYIKTPPTIEAGNYIKNSYNSSVQNSTGTTISSPISRVESTENENKVEEKETSSINEVTIDIPLTEYDESNKKDDSIEARADAFARTYVQPEDIEVNLSSNEPSPIVQENSLNLEDANLGSFEGYLDEEDTGLIEDEIVSPTEEETQEMMETFIKETENEQNKELDNYSSSEENVAPSNLTSRRARDIFFEEEVEENQKAIGEEPKDNGFSSRGISSRDLGRRDLSSRTVGGLGRNVFEEQKEEIEEIEENKKELKPHVFNEYVRPPLDLLETYARPVDLPEEDHEERKSIIKQTLNDFGIMAEPQGHVQGPSITRYEIMMPRDISVKKVSRYDEDLQMRLAVRDGVRIEAPIPGKDLVGIEVANKYKVTVGLKEIMQGMAGQKSKPYSLMFAIGKDVVGSIKSDDLAKGPHYLVAGTTGSGKSVCLNAMITSLIMRYGPQDLRFILIDPKRVEFKKYEHLPHLLVDEIINDPQKVLAALTWAYNETERRNQIFENCEVPCKDLEAYNTNIAKNGNTRLPRIVIIVDELSDLMARARREIDEKITMIAQKARSAGIHLVLATQYPSTAVITMTMKANLPSRIAFKVASHVESTVILNETGADKLLGNGDMLYKNSSQSNTERYQGAFIADSEIHGIVSYIKENNETYFDEELQGLLDAVDKAKQEARISQEMASRESEAPVGGISENNDTFIKSVALAITCGSISISQLQRRFQIGYSKAGGIVDKMEMLGYIGASEGSGKGRKVLITRQEYEEKYGPFPE